MQTQDTSPYTMPSASQTVSTVREEWRTLARPWWQAALAVMPTFLITRLIFVLLTYFGGLLFTIPNYSTEVMTFRDVLYKWYRWDAIRFITIANQGYTSPDYTAFFPLYPTIEHWVSKALHMDVLLTGMLISNLAFLGTLIVLYRLVADEFGQETARRAVLYLSIFPTALFFFAAYNESLFLFFLLLSFYCLRRGHWWLSGIVGGLATLTRSAGLLLAVVFVCEFLRQQLPTIREVLRKRAPLQIAAAFAGLPAVLLIPFGLGVYAYGLTKSFHNPLAFSQAQVEWRVGLSGPWVAPFQTLHLLIRENIFTFNSAHLLIDLGALILFLVLMLLTIWGPYCFARQHWTYILFGLLALLFFVIFPGIPRPNDLPYDPLPSMQRLVLEIFPAFIVMAQLGRRQWFHQGYLYIGLPLLTFLTLQFMTGHWTV